VAVKIRLKRMGKIRTPFYRVVVADSRTKRDGRVIEEIGTYNPKADPSIIHIESERAQYWLGVGAQPSDAVAVLLKLTGDWQQFKGESAPGPMKVAEPKRDKAEIFNEALKDVHAEPKSEAVTTSRPARKKAAAKSTAVPSAVPAEDSPAPESPAPESPAPESPAPSESASPAPSEAPAPAEASAATGDDTDAEAPAETAKS